MTYGSGRPTCRARAKLARMFTCVYGSELGHSIHAVETVWMPPERTWRTLSAGRRRARAGVTITHLCSVRLRFSSSACQTLVACQVAHGHYESRSRVVMSRCCRLYTLARLRRTSSNQTKNIEASKVRPQVCCTPPRTIRTLGNPVKQNGLQGGSFPKVLSRTRFHASRFGCVSTPLGIVGTLARPVLDFILGETVFPCSHKDVRGKKSRILCSRNCPQFLQSCDQVCNLERCFDQKLHRGEATLGHRHTHTYTHTHDTQISTSADLHKGTRPGHARRHANVCEHARECRRAHAHGKRAADRATEPPVRPLARPPMPFPSGPSTFTRSGCAFHTQTGAHRQTRAMARECRNFPWWGNTSPEAWKAWTKISIAGHPGPLRLERTGLGAQRTCPSKCRLVEVFLNGCGALIQDVLPQLGGAGFPGIAMPPSQVCASTARHLVKAVRRRYS